VSGLQPGSELGGGKYRIVRLLGKGGMGSVFEAENTLTQKRVAIKWMHAELATQLDAPARLLREAQASARVRHPNVVDVYDVGLEGGTVFLVMEYLEGEPLTALLARGTQPMYQIIALLLPAMRAVAAAHRQGVIHRDLKPDNIFLAVEADAVQPVPKVLDFGISKLDSQGDEQLSLTRSGSTLGTPRYMSYEQLVGDKNVDSRTDVYSLGVILYEALTGQLPYDAESFPELIVKIATQAPTFPKELRADIPTPLGKIILWAMARERDQRIPSVDALINELTPFSTDYGFRAQMTLPGSSVPSLPRPEASGERDAQPSAAAAQKRAEAKGAVAHASTPSSPRFNKRKLMGIVLALGASAALALLLPLAAAPAPSLRERPPTVTAQVAAPLPPRVATPSSLIATLDSAAGSTAAEATLPAPEQDLDAQASQAPSAVAEPVSAPASAPAGGRSSFQLTAPKRPTGNATVAARGLDPSAALEVRPDAGPSVPTHLPQTSESPVDARSFRVRTLPKSSDFY
jgi:serine/threonine protein kinase